MSKHNTAEVIDPEQTVPATDDRLSNLPGSSGTRDINRMMDQLEEAIGKLDRKLAASNRKTRKDIKQLLESDADIGDKVAEIYRQLGLVDARFSDLKKDSTELGRQLKSLQQQIESSREQTLVALADSLENQGEINLGLQQEQQQLIERAEALARKTTSLTRKLNKSIKDNSLALTELESRIVAEMERIAEASEQRDGELDQRLQQQRSDTDEQLQQHQARMLKLQRVDEALDKRAGKLETLTGQLLEDSEELQQQSEMLTVASERLTADLEALQLKSAQLAAESQRHRGFIEQLQQSGRELSRQLLALGRREDRRFVILSGFGLLLLVALVTLFGYGQLQRSEDNLALDQRAIDTQNQIQDLQVRALNQQASTGQLDQGLAQLQQQVASVRKQLVEVNDQVTSLDARIAYIAPFQRFGGDNVLHGSQWLAKLNPQHYSIRLARVDNTQAMFDLVQRYASYLPEPVAYYPDAKGGFVLVYGGDFADAGEVEEALRALPYSLNFHTPQPIANRDILNAIRS